jgi:hypothetical protein
MGLTDLGLEVLPQKTGRPVRVSNDGQPEWGYIGFTIAWDLVTAEVADTELADGTPVKAGEKAIRYGTALVKITGGAQAGKWAPFVDAAADGQGTLTRDEVGILDMTMVNNEKYAGHTGLIVGGGVYRQRLNVGAAPLPALAALLAVMPRLRLSPVE